MGNEDSKSTVTVPSCGGRKSRTRAQIKVPGRLLERPSVWDQAMNYLLFKFSVELMPKIELLFLVASNHLLCSPAGSPLM